MALERVDLGCEEQLEHLMFKVAAVCIDTIPEPLPESKDGFVDWRLRKISPDAFEHRLEFYLASVLELVEPIPLLTSLPGRDSQAG